ncbi:MAG: D-tyrosyl-tRNA(Tyr) deacylase [Bacteroidaceae bacterium]|nr:D-tyrosyl-tRNA(Tyr) deacylase [Bacteroidaceae bacterium]
MKVVIQRVASASVDIAGERVSEIGAGLLILLGVVPDDTESDLEWLVKKCSQMRIFNDDAGVMNRSVMDVGGDVMVVSQFTLAASTKKGNRPSYIGAAGHDLAIPMYERFCQRMSEVIGRPVGRGRFGADMQVGLVNDGPVTIIVDSKNPV